MSLPMFVTSLTDGITLDSIISRTVFTLVQGSKLYCLHSTWITRVVDASAACIILYIQSHVNRRSALQVGPDAILLDDRLRFRGTEKFQEVAHAQIDFRLKLPYRTSSVADRKHAINRTGNATKYSRS